MRASIWMGVIGTIVGLPLVLAALAIAPVAQAYWSMPVSNRASAYTLGIRSALTSDNLHEIWAGKAPKILFQTRERDPNNKYVWQEARLVRIGDCVDVIEFKPGDIKAHDVARPSECAQPHKLEPLPDRFQFSIDKERSLSVRVSAKQPQRPLMIARGGLFGVEGEIITGLIYKHATSFKIEFEADALDPADVGPELAAGARRPVRAAGENCDPARLVRPRGHYIMSLLPPTPARLCRYFSKNKRVLALVHYRSGPMQHLRFTDVVMCRALLDEMLIMNPLVDVAGCVGGRWGEQGPPKINFVLFDTTPQTYVALFK